MELKKDPGNVLIKVIFMNKNITDILNKTVMQFIQEKNAGNPECLPWPQIKQSSIKFTATAPLQITLTCCTCGHEFQHVEFIPHSFLLDMEKICRL